MNSEPKENLSELVAKFYDSGEAERIAGDIEKGDQLLAEFDTHNPGKAVIANIKSSVDAKLRASKPRRLRQLIYISAAAAVFILIATLTVHVPRQKAGRKMDVFTASIIPAAIWQSDDIAAEDDELSILNAELEELESELIAVEFSEKSGENGNAELAEIEIELMEIDNDFWKG